MPVFWSRSTHACSFTRLHVLIVLRRAPREGQRGYFARMLCTALLTSSPTRATLSPVHGASTPVRTAHGAADARQDPALARRFRPSLALWSCLGESSHRRRTALPDFCVAFRLLTESKLIHPVWACTTAVAACSNTAETAHESKWAAEVGRGDDGSNTRVILACVRPRTTQVTARCFLDNVIRELVLCTHHRGKSFLGVSRSHATKHKHFEACAAHTHARLREYSGKRDVKCARRWKDLELTPPQ